MLTKQPCGKPLRDIMHDFLPDLSKWVHVRDILLCILCVPILYIPNKVDFVIQCVQAFSIVVMIKAASIFFTFIPPSNPDCQTKKYVNHCFHSSTSGHAALVVILGILYMKYLAHFTAKKEIICVSILLYCLLILMTRAHYTVDVIQGVVVSTLIMLGDCSTCIY